MQLKFSKMYSHGQDILVTEMVTLEGFVRSNTIQRLANRITGVGFNYFLLIEHPKYPQQDFDCLLFDSQGTPVPFNAAAARCAARFIRDKGLTGKTQLRLGFQQQEVSVEFINKNQLKVQLLTPVFEPQQIGLQLERYKAEYDVPMGELGYIQLAALKLNNLLVTVRVDDLSATPCAHWGEQICQNSLFASAPQVGFMQIVDDNHMKLATFSQQGPLDIDELAAAAVISAQLRGYSAGNATVQHQQHEIQIDWDATHSLYSTGSANYVYDGRVYI